MHAIALVQGVRNGRAGFRNTHSGTVTVKRERVKVRNFVNNGLIDLIRGRYRRVAQTEIIDMVFTDNLSPFLCILKEFKDNVFFSKHGVIMSIEHSSLLA